MKHAFKQASRKLNQAMELLVSSMGVLMALVVGCQVFSRYVLNHSLFWSEEMARILLVTLTFFGATVAYYRKAHPGVDGLYRRLPRSLRTWADRVVVLSGLALFSVMIIYGAGFAWFVRLQITPAMGIPKWVVLAVVPLAGLVFMVHGLAFLAGAEEDPEA